MKEFHIFLLCLDREMLSKQRQVLLLVDKCTSHTLPNQPLPDVTLRFLPANTTAHLQPLESGIIQSFKTRYRKHVSLYSMSRPDREHEHRR